MQEFSVSLITTACVLSVSTLPERKAAVDSGIDRKAIVICI